MLNPSSGQGNDNGKGGVSLANEKFSESQIIVKAVGTKRPGKDAYPDGKF